MSLIIFLISSTETIGPGTLPSSAFLVSVICYSQSDGYTTGDSLAWGIQGWVLPLHLSPLLQVPARESGKDLAVTNTLTSRPLSHPAEPRPKTLEKLPYLRVVLLEIQLLFLPGMWHDGVGRANQGLWYNNSSLAQFLLTNLILCLYGLNSGCR